MQRKNLQPEPLTYCLRWVSDSDVRDLGGRAVRMLVSCVAGFAAAFVVAGALPMGHIRLHTFVHAPWLGSNGVSPVLVLAGGLGLFLGCYALLGMLARRTARPRRLAVVRRRAELVPGAIASFRVRKPRSGD
jgi:hypothetical protein